MDKTEESSSSFKIYILYPLIVGLIGTIAGWILNSKFAPPDKNSENLVIEQKNEVIALSKGFADLVNVINKSNKTLAPDVTIALNTYAQKVADLAQSTNRLSAQFDLKNDFIDTSVRKIKLDNQTLSIKDEEEGQQFQEEKIRIQVGDINAKRISIKSQFAVVKEIEEAGKWGLVINMNSSIYKVFPGDQKFSYSESGKNYYLIFDGKLDNHYEFRVVGR